MDNASYLLCLKHFYTLFFYFIIFIEFRVFFLMNDTENKCRYKHKNFNYSDCIKQHTAFRNPKCKRKRYCYRHYKLMRFFVFHIKICKKYHCNTAENKVMLKRKRKEIRLNNLCCTHFLSLPFNSCRRFCGYIVNYSVYMTYFIYNS